MILYGNFKGTWDEGIVAYFKMLVMSFAWQDCEEQRNIWAQESGILEADPFSVYVNSFFSFGATAHIWALAYLHETFRFTSVY
jgi:hypothetical protein